MERKWPNLACLYAVIAKNRCPLCVGISCTTCWCTIVLVQKKWRINGESGTSQSNQLGASRLCARYRDSSCAPAVSDPAASDTFVASLRKTITVYIDIIGVLHNWKKMALFTQGLKNAARTGLGKQVGAAAAAYSKIVSSFLYLASGR